MAELLIGKDTAVITMLLLFITGLLTKRVVPWYVHEDALKKLQKYEDAAPGLIEEVTRLMETLDAREAAVGERVMPTIKGPIIKHTVKARSPSNLGQTPGKSVSVTKAEKDADNE